MLAISPIHLSSIVFPFVVASSQATDVEDMAGTLQHAIDEYVLKHQVGGDCGRHDLLHTLFLPSNVSCCAPYFFFLIYLATCCWERRQRCMSSLLVPSVTFLALQFSKCYRANTGLESPNVELAMTLYTHCL